ncbi:Tol-Pal system beta propeller repeat TolB [Dinoroseobacter shibae DFL 12 = DSM 16493]|jgi:TolB protein|uniref:Tol-Pal system protein TolB n=1 Tax=Dinoroseobacter shibae (strain DSM 16493 / NCIMB 14021 / DFL 12) TaxID=398580 RepID=TOLB_DINSH|nr:Tol-Pal system beta propeller repeat protein TolB [Dinoroseobacter shibae]A8LHQ6.1 RecName: Full=Tol-Pal system protein TolB; Flags: Precursor [Dinoroseobacter shibae DFL 12 = DSM 16493]ABV92853.1 Tol-Pal system beta propeller repeat TolB [Dinoroseobacter shibae DFL 12 = DSM 16493]URF47791.1 Tol-Pal system beta propeller repeat protein TolB [Dinoroseobacter shibae]URF52101.1 Tol-Pal system beta propeller repeat protein TolB [Dinoroseobacter shibae]
MKRAFLSALSVGLAALFLTGPAQAQGNPGPLRIEITEGVIEPLPIAVPPFLAETPAASQFARDIAQVVADDLEGSGLFRAIPENAFISPITSFDSPVQYADWKAINAQALVTGSVSVASDGRLVVKFRLFDVFSDAPLGKGLQFVASQSSWRRMGHKVADAVYSRITGEGGYFDSRVVFVSETGPKNARQKRLAIMDYDGANVQFLTDSSAIVLAPRFSPTGDRVLYTSYATGRPQITLLDVNSVRSQGLGSAQGGEMSFAPRFSPDGRSVVFSLTNGGNSDIYRRDLSSGAQTRLTATPAIETAPSFSPDGRQIVFESDRSGSQQLYVMSATGGEARRISFGPGRYGTPVWSPRGDLIAFTKQNQGRFHIGVMRTDGSEERLLTSSFLDESPTWSPNGRVIMFTRETSGAGGAPSLYSVDISGRNLRRVPTPGAASDPAWSPLLP